jgi:hypothetical protein
MKKNAALKILNPILLVLFVSEVVTGLFHAKLSHETFEFLHEGGGLLLLGLFIIHLILNFNWIKTSYLSK